MAGDGGRAPDVSEQRAEVDEGYCPRCGQYMPMALNGSARIHDCDRTPPGDGLPPTIYACPMCGGHGLSRYGCWGTAENPHEHAYMRPVHELVRERRTPFADPASVLAALLAEQPDATVAALETLLTSERVVLLATVGQRQVDGYYDQEAVRAAILAACRSLRPKAPKEDRDA